MRVAKTKAKISVTAKLICVFVFAYAKRLFSHDAAQIRRCQKCSILHSHVHVLTVFNTAASFASSERLSASKTIYTQRKLSRDSTKTVSRVFDQVRHNLGCSTTEDS